MIVVHRTRQCRQTNIVPQIHCEEYNKVKEFLNQPFFYSCMESSVFQKQYISITRNISTLFSKNMRKAKVVIKIFQIIIIDQYKYYSSKTTCLEMLKFLSTCLKNGLAYENCVQVRFMVFNTTFNNISVISWRLVLLVEEH